MAHCLSGRPHSVSVFARYCGESSGRFGSESSGRLKVSGVVLREVDSLIRQTGLLSDGDPGRSPWAKSLGSSPPQLAQDWVNELKKVCGEGTTWHELAMLVPEIEHCFMLLMYAARYRPATPPTARLFVLAGC